MSQLLSILLLSLLDAGQTTVCLTFEGMPCSTLRKSRLPPSAASKNFCNRL